MTLSLRMLDGATRSAKVVAATNNPNIWNVRPHSTTWIGFPQTLPEPMPPYLEHTVTPFWFQRPAGWKLVYCQINSVRNMPIPANVSELFWQSSWPGDRRTWIAPLLFAPPTFAAFRRNQDPAMEAIAEYRRSTQGEFARP